MACRQIELNFCAECRQINKANIFNCRWLQFNFCTLTCLKRFYARIVVECDLCKLKFNHIDRVHVRDDVPKILEDSHTFICDQCFDGRTELAKRCHYCTKICYETFGAQLMTTTGLIKKYRCSSDCQPKLVNPKQLTVCSVCGCLNKCQTISYNDQIYAICSAMCLENFRESEKVSVGSFLLCLTISVISISIFCIFF